METNMSECGCVWERHPDYGDIIVKQCEEHSRSRPRSRSKPKVRLVGPGASVEEIAAVIVEVTKD